MPTRIKICGITRVEDALAACAAGADALGFVFHPPSPRNVAPDNAREIVAALPPFVCAVGLFVDRKADEIERILGNVPLDMLQFHGDEAPELCARFGRAYLKAVRMRPEVDLLEYARRFGDARGLLLDAFVSGTHGGTGTRFDWGLVPANLSMPIVLSGGLTPENVAEAVQALRPWAVDVSSGVEGAPGQKSAEKLRVFVEAVRKADSAND